MAVLPQGWEWDYDGARWFYTYKPTGHIQYHFPNEGDEFPDFVDAASPVPQLAPEERLESQQQVRRHSSQHQPHSSTGAGDAAERWKSRMTATARPVSSVWEEEERRHNREVPAGGAFQPESFMFLGPGVYADVSPPVEDEEEEAARRVIAGGSPEVSIGTLTPMGTGRAGLSSTGSVSRAVTPGGEEEAEEEEGVVHMLDGREMPLELPAEERFNPVGMIAEMATGETSRARAETHPDPVEIGDNTVLAPIETAVQKVVPEWPGKGSPVGRGPKSDSDELEEKQQDAQQGEKSEQQQQQQEQHQGEKTAEQGEPPISVASEPADGPKYRSYNPDQVDGSSQNDTEFDPSSVPAALSLHKRSPSPERHPEKVPSPEQERSLDLVPSPLKAAESEQKPSSIQGSPQPSPLIIETRPSQAPSSEFQTYQDPQGKQPEITKVPSVLKPARGRVPSQPTRVNATRSKNQLPRKSYLQTVDDTQSAPASPDELPPSERKYIPYTGQEHIQTQQPFGLANVMPIMGPRLHPVHGTSSEQQHQLNQAQIHRPASTPAVITPLHPKPYTIIQAAPAVPTSNPSPSVRGTAVVGPSEISPLRSRSASLTSIAPGQSPSPVDRRRRASSAASQATSMDSTAPFTPSPDSQTPLSGSRSNLSPLARQSGLRNPISDPMPYNSPETVVSPGPPVPRKVPLEPEPGSYFPPQDPAASALPTKHSLPPSTAPALTHQVTPAVPSGPSGPALPPKIHEQPSLNLLRPQPTRETPQPAPTQQREPPPPIQSPPIQSVTTPGHVLTRIEEHDDESILDETPRSGGASSQPSLAQKRSISESLHQSLGRESPASGSVASSVSVPAAAVAQQVQMTSSQVHVVNHGQRPAAAERPGQQGTPPQGQVQRQVPQVQLPPQGQSHPVSNMPHPAIPPQEYPGSGFPQQPWNSQMAPNTAPGFGPGPVPPQPRASPAPKEKEKKWARWFKGSKTPKPSQPVDHQYFVPAPGQMPPSGVQGPPPPGWAPGTYGQPVAWQPGQPPQGYPQDPYQQQQTSSQFAQWQPVHGPPGPGAMQQPPPGLHRRNTGASTSRNESGRQNRHSMDFQRLQPGTPIQGTAAAASATHSHAWSTTNLPPQSSNGNRGPYPVDAALMPRPLFFKPPAAVPHGHN